MKFSELLAKLKKSKHYETFKTQYPASYLAAGFLIFNLERNNETTQLDFFLPAQQKIASFEINPETSEFQPVKIHDDKTKEIPPQQTNIKPDLDKLAEAVKDIIRKNNSKTNPTQIIAIIKENQ